MCAYPQNRIQNVAVVGAGGQVGKFIVDALLRKGTFKVTALTRRGSSNKPVGVRLAHINYDDPKTIVEALREHDALVITMSSRAPSDQQEKLIRAAAEAEVPWILPNEWGLDGTNEQLGRDVVIGPPKQKDRELIGSLGKSKWIGIASLFWYEYSLGGPGLFGIDIDKREVTWFDEGNVKLHTTTWPQTGRAVAQLLSSPIYARDEDDKSTTLSSYANRYVYINSFTLTQREMFQSVKRVTGATDKDWSFKMVSSKERYEENTKVMLAGGPRIHFAYQMYTRMFFPDGVGVFEGKELDNERLGLPKEDLDIFTEEAVKLSGEHYFEFLLQA